MRFTLNTFVVSTIALLSLTTPVVNANAANITIPSSGQILTVYEQLVVKWTINNKQNLDGVNCDIVLLHVGSDPYVPGSPGLLESGVPILNGQSNGNVTIKDLTSGNDYYMQLILSGQTTVLGQSDTFSIV